MQSSSRLTAGEVADLAGGTLVGNGETPIAGVATLESAGPGDLSFLSTARYLSAFRRSHAGVVLVAPAFQSEPGGPVTRIVVSSPRIALSRVLSVIQAPPCPVWGVHPKAIVGVGTTWKGRIAVGSGAVIGREVRLGENCVVSDHVVIGDGVRIGSECRFFSHAVVESGTRLGDRVVLHPGARVGTAGFGYARSASGHDRIQHIGGCVIEDDVEIGSNTTIDRGALDDTVVGTGTKIDNLVQIAHNVKIGRNCLIMAQVGIAGSTAVDDDAILAGQAGLADHLTVGAGARVAAQSGVIGDIPAGATVSGYPARNHREVLRNAAALKRLAPLTKRLENLALSDERSE